MHTALAFGFHLLKQSLHLRCQQLQDSRDLPWTKHWALASGIA